MFQRAQHLSFLLLAAGLLAAACQQRQEIDDEEAAADTTGAMTDEMAPPPAGADASLEPDTAMGEGDGSAQVSVTNSMPHAMTVKADWGEGENELGTVEPNETKSFDVEAPAGTQVTLTATDAQASHSTSGSVTVGPDQPAAWTIQ